VGESGLALNLDRALLGLFGNSLPSTSESASSKACTWPDCRNDDRRARLRASRGEDQDPFMHRAGQKDSIEMRLLDEFGGVKRERR